MSYKTVRQAQNAVWPPVRDSLKLHQASRAAAREGKPLSRMEERDNAKSWNRIVSEETVWALAKADLIASAETAAVVKAAKEWVKASQAADYTPRDMDPDERALYNAVQELAVSFDPPADEALHLSPESSTVGSTNH